MAVPCAQVWAMAACQACRLLGRPAYSPAQHVPPSGPLAVHSMLGVLRWCAPLPCQAPLQAPCAAPRQVHARCLARMSLGPQPCARSAMAPGHPRKIPWWKRPRAPWRQRRPLRPPPRRRLLSPHPNRHPCPVLAPTLPRDAARTLQLISPRTASATLATRSRPRRPRIKRIACSRLLPWATRRLAVYPRPCMLLLRMRRP